ncbi:MAG: site-specific integrase [Planctomycetota bacterium]
MARPSKPHVSKGWWRTRIGGRTYWLGKATNGDTLTREAEAEFHRLKAEALREHAAGTPQTVNGLVEAWRVLNPKPCYRGWLRALQGFAGTTRLDQIDRALLTRYHSHLTTFTYRRLGRKADNGERVKLEPHKLAPETVRHWIRTAVAVLAWGVEVGYVRTMPIRPRRLNRAVQEPRDVDPATLRAALGNVNGNAGRILRFIAATGCRPSEACNLEWRHVRIDLATATLEKHKTAHKTGKVRTIYLTPEALAVLAKLTPHPGHVFTNRHGQPYTSGGLRAILRRRGIRSPYALRHTFAQSRTEADMPVDVLAELLGHANTRTTKHYYEVRADRARRYAAGVVLGLPAMPEPDAKPERKAAAV